MLHGTALTSDSGGSPGQALHSDIANSSTAHLDYESSEFTSIGRG